MKRFVLCLLLSACDIKDHTPVEIQMETAKAQRIIWIDYFGLEVSTLPKVIWVEAECLGPIGQPGVFEKTIGCVAGYYVLNTIRLPLPFAFISDTAFSHEHIHAWHSLSGINDYNHLRPEWSTLPYELDALLKESGL